MIHDNSLESYHSGLNTFSARQQKVLVALALLHRATDRQIMEHLGFSDLNAVRPRITELVQRGILTEAASTRDPITGKTVRLVQVNHRKPQELIQQSLF
jgi:predicted HTH transcriptional regulator